MIVKNKQKFSTRWINQFARRYEGIKEVLKFDFVANDEFDDVLHGIEDALHDSLTAVARAAKVSPKTLAKFLHSSKDSADNIKYVESVSAEISKLREKDAKDAAKPKKKTKKDTKKKAK